MRGTTTTPSYIFSRLAAYSPIRRRTSPDGAWVVGEGRPRLAPRACLLPTRAAAAAATSIAAAVTTIAAARGGVAVFARFSPLPGGSAAQADGTVPRRRGGLFHLSASRALAVGHVAEVGGGSRPEPGGIRMATVGAGGVG